MPKRYIIMGGISGCMPAHVDCCDTLTACYDIARTIYDDCIDMGFLADLRKRRYSDRITGNDYVKIVETDCQSCGNDSSACEYLEE